MKPTPQLRFIERYMPTPELGENIGKPVRILQQRWENPEMVLTVHRVGPNGLPEREYVGEWRDVPLEKEA
jgi:hypothetical protein